MTDKVTFDFFTGAELRRLPAGTAIFSQGEKRPGAFMLCSGRACLIMCGVNGRVLLKREIEAGDVVGIATSFTEEPLGMTAEATTEVEIAFARREQVLAAMRHAPQLAIRILEHLSSEVQLVRTAVH